MRNTERSGKIFVILVLLAAMALECLGCAAPGNTDGQTLPTDSAPTQTQPREPEPTCPPDGDEDNVTCQGSYTRTGQALEERRDTVVAQVGDSCLTNRELWVYYWVEVADYLRENPDLTFSQGLDTLMCGVVPDLTWQQYFLDRALKAWHSYAALNLKGTLEGTPTEAAYQPIDTFHEKNLNEDMPALKYLYGYTNASYVPNSLHQDYLDSLPELLETMATENGYADAEALAADTAGAAKEDLVSWGQLYNRAYMYFTECTYYLEPTREEVEEYLAQNAETFAAIEEDEILVDFRHILAIPENASVAQDGTVTAGEEDWENAYDEVYGLYVRAQYNSFPEDTFAEWANASSDDEGSRLNGGLYSGIHRGQLTDVLDSWLFDPARRPGDRAMLQSDCGWHLMYFSGSTTARYAAAREALLAERTGALVTGAMESYPISVDYSLISLAPAAREGAAPDLGQLLYPDIAHQRYPSAPLYFQQDYPHTYYGQYPIASWGCGITTMAMLSSYMTDEEWTPPELCAIYGYYCAERGTNIVMYDDVPAEMGFYLEKRTWDWNEVVAALENGQVVACLQYAGYWTKGGHFLLLQRVTEDGLIEVRDSNIFNFGTLSGHQINAHEPSVITPKGAYYWIYQTKITRIPACWRCDDTDHQDVPTALFREEYCCPKCRTAMTRRSQFLTACAQVK